MSESATSRRKEEHLRINLEHDVQFQEVSTGLENYHFLHQALPELDAAAIDLSLKLLGKRLRAPLVISAMTGGIPAAAPINCHLAQAAQALGLAFGVGSQRLALEDPALIPTYQVREVAPDILLLANLGAVQLNYGYGLDDCRRAVDMIGADALVLHLNPLQEALQPGGDTDFSGLLAKIEAVCRGLEVPVVVKEVGWGISGEVARRLAGAGVAAIDVAGAGGTSWSRVERHRTTPQTREVAAAFSRWGIPTAQAILMACQGAPGTPLVASGGLRTGLDVAKALALGADAAGLASPLLKPATLSAQEVVGRLEEVILGLRIAMFCIGAASLAQLKGTPFLQPQRPGWGSLIHQDVRLGM